VPYRVSLNFLDRDTSSENSVFIFFGAALLFGSPGALLITAAHLPLVGLFIRRQERQLQAAFGDDWIDYKKRVRRWL
jgi:protein-S-isoprenylcysteine O-methyltransferase Ste14